MSKPNRKNKKFSLSVSLDQVQSEHSGFLIDLRKKEEKQREAQKKISKNKNQNILFWKAKRITSSLPFFFKPLTRYFRGGIFLDCREEELRDRLGAFEKKVFKRTFLGRLSSFLLVLLVIFIPLKLLAYYKLFDPQILKERISANSHLAVNDLMSAAFAASKMDMKTASNDFSGAVGHFLQAEGDLKNIDESLLQLAALSGNKELQLAANGKKFLSAGVVASSLGQHLSLAFDSLFSKGDSKDSLRVFIKEGNKSLEYSRELSKILSEINPESLPDEYRQRFLDLKKSALALDEALTEIIPMVDELGKLLGVDRDQRYLLIFQNNTELRGGGGFMGSYALIDFSGGKVKNLEIPGGGTYDTKGGLTTFVKSPAALRLIAPRWFFWDANWFPDWSLSADNIRWFYEKSGGPTVDGVIAFTPDIISGLLEITGPIDLTNEYGVVVDANNFYEITQQITEKDNLVKDGQLSAESFKKASSTPEIKKKTAIEIKQDLERNQGKKPKKIIGDLTAKILTELPKKVDRANIAKLLSLFDQSLSKKQLMFNFSNPELQAEAESRNWAGRQEKTSGDYLMVVNSNISGGKSDYKISEKIEQTTEIKIDGKIINTVKITRKHNGIKGEKLFGMKNVDWLRIYVPQGSRLISSSGFEAPSDDLFKSVEENWSSRPVISEGEDQAFREENGTMVYDENGKTVFANWLMVDPGTEVSVEFSYYLPFNLTFPQEESDWRSKLSRFVLGETEKLTSYSLLVQKQPGAKASEYSGRLILDDAQLNNVWVYPEEKNLNRSGWLQNISLDQDRSFGALIKNNY